MTRFFYVVSFLLFSVLSYSQNALKAGYTVYVNYPECNVKVDVSSISASIAVKEELEYYWYSSNKIFKTKGGYDGKLLNGNYTSFYLSNNLKEKGLFKNGLKNGTWISWLENGLMSEKVTWRKGRMNGEYRRFNAKGELMLKYKYKNGKLNGIQIEYANNKILKETKFKNGEEIIKKDKTASKAGTSKSIKSKLQLFFQKKNKDSSKKSRTNLKDKLKKKKRTESDTPKEEKEEEKESRPIVKKNMK